MHVLLAGSLALSSTPAACEVGKTHPSLRAAIADTACEVVHIGPVALWETVHIGRPVTLLGSGRDATLLYCGRGPCITTDPRAHGVLIASMSIASTGPTIEARSNDLQVVGVRFSHLGHRGGHVRLRDASATFLDVEIETADLPAIDAVAHYGSELHMERTQFFGVQPTSGTRGAIYGSTYSLRCADCSFHPYRQYRVKSLLWDDELPTTETGRSASHYWPQRDCPRTGPEEEELCSAQCGRLDVALCRMVYEVTTEACRPEARCVPDGEVPGVRDVPERGTAHRLRKRDRPMLPWPSEG